MGEASERGPGFTGGAFRRLYKNGKNYVTANDVKRTFRREYSGLLVEFVSLEQLIWNLSKD